MEIDSMHEPTSVMKHILIYFHWIVNNLIIHNLLINYLNLNNKSIQKQLLTYVL